MSLFSRWFQRAPAPTAAVKLEADWRTSWESAAQIPAEEFWLRLAETLAWCDALPTVDALRQSNLQFAYFSQSDDGRVRDVGWARASALCNWEQHTGSMTYGEPGGGRAHAAAQNQKRTSTEQALHRLPTMSGGRLLVYFPDENLCDGVSEVASGGFFDVNNCPPPATWVSYFADDRAVGPCRTARKYVLCYVPAPLVPAVTEGIEVNAESCIGWLEDSAVILREEWSRLVAAVIA